MKTYSPSERKIFKVSLLICLIANVLAFIYGYEYKSSGHGTGIMIYPMLVSGWTVVQAVISLVIVLVYMIGKNSQMTRAFAINSIITLLIGFIITGFNFSILLQIG